VGLLAAALYLLLQEPASFALRVLMCTVQVLLVTSVYYLLLSVQRRPALGGLIATGGVLGLLCLTYPPAVMLAVAVVPWLFWQSPRRASDGLRAALPLAVAAVLIAPATIHNWRTGAGLSLVQAVSGVNLFRRQSAAIGRRLHAHPQHRHRA